MTEYTDVMARKEEILKKSTGFDYSSFRQGKVGFDYEKMMKAVNYSLDEIMKIQRDQHVGNTPPS